MYIYLITNKINGKHYIGQTFDYTRRCYQHKNNTVGPSLLLKM